MRLPAEGRKGRPPRWPLADNPKLTGAVIAEQAIIDELEDRQDTEGLVAAEASRLTRARRRLAVAEETLRLVRDTEAKIWRDIWHTPQAVEWERLRYTREVAQYVRWKAMAEVGIREASVEARMLADSLGLTPKAMRSLMWTIAPDEVTEARQAEEANATAKERRARFRLAAVDSAHLQGDHS